MEINGLEEFNFSTEKIDKLKKFKELFLAYNLNVNLTSRKSIDKFDMINLRDSFGILKFYSFKTGQNILDIGTGGGFPGFILAIIFPETNFYLNDSNKKKTDWIEFAKKELGLENVFIINARVEKMDAKYYGFFDIVISRAVARIAILLEISIKYLKINGEFIFYKGDNIEDEITKRTSFLQKELGVQFTKMKWWFKSKKKFCIL